MQMLGLRANLDKQTTQNNLNNMKLSRFSADLDNLVQLKDKLNSDLNTKNNILKLKEDENIKFRLENAKITKSREILMKKMVLMDGTKTNLENETLKLKYALELNEILFTFLFYILEMSSQRLKKRENKQKSL